MYHGSAVTLLEAIQHDRGVEAAVARVSDAHGRAEWLVAAQSSNGELWRIRHTDLLLAVVLLERMIGSAPRMGRL